MKINNDKLLKFNEKINIELDLDENTINSIMIFKNDEISFIMSFNRADNSQEAVLTFDVDHLKYFLIFLNQIHSLIESHKLQNEISNENSEKGRSRYSSRRSSFMNEEEPNIDDICYF